MRATLHWFFALLLILSIVNCKSNQQISKESKTIDKIPISLHVETTISGVVLGKKLLSPMGVAVDRYGHLYLTDSGNNRLIKFDPELVPIRDIGGHGSEPGLFDLPGYVTIDNDLNILITDRDNRRICRHDSNLEYVYEIEMRDDDDPFKFGRPSGVAITGFGEVWIADSERNRLAIFDNIGRFERMVGDYGYEGGELRNPQKILMDKDRFLVCDADGGRVVIYDEFGNYEGDFSGRSFDRPISITMDKFGLLWLLDAGANYIICLDQSGFELFRTQSTITGTGIALRSPSDITFLKDGRLVITDSGNNRVLICQPLYINESN